MIWNFHEHLDVVHLLPHAASVSLCSGLTGYGYIHDFHLFPVSRVTIYFGEVLMVQNRFDDVPTLMQ